MSIQARYQDRRGRQYVLLEDGSIRRTFPVRPWRGKSERRRVIKARKESR